jgi:hypothetical protein
LNARTSRCDLLDAALATQPIDPIVTAPDGVGVSK